MATETQTRAAKLCKWLKEDLDRLSQTPGWSQGTTAATMGVMMSHVAELGRLVSPPEVAAASEATQGHTPGPLTARQTDIVDQHGSLVAEVYAYGSLDEQQANAVLFAAAPELAEACREVLAFAEACCPEDHLVHWQPRLDLCRAALAKAGCTDAT